MAQLLYVNVRRWGGLGLQLRSLFPILRLIAPMAAGPSWDLKMQAVRIAHECCMTHEISRISSTDEANQRR